MALADPAGGDARPPAPAPHLDAASRTEGGDCDCAAGGPTIDASELARDDGRANGSWNVGAGFCDVAGGRALISGEAGCSARNMPRPTPSSAPVMVLVGELGVAVSDKARLAGYIGSAGLSNA